MTKSSNHPDADYTIRDMGIPDRLPSKKAWEKHTPEWEGWSKEEKQKWIAEHEGEDFSIRYYDTTKADRVEKLDEMDNDLLP